MALTKTKQTITPQNRAVRLAYHPQTPQTSSYFILCPMMVFLIGVLLIEKNVG